MNNLTAQEQLLLQQVAALPGTTVAPGRNGGGVTVYHQVSTAHIKSRTFWTGRPFTVQRLGEYLKARTELEIPR
jgi:hypothetical protein